ncbi:MAG: hypothetical protein K5770_04390 [Lachnospiraceae bacterium]|nr:hypothetical protein [Lachnospiraceae bacterium]
MKAKLTAIFFLLSLCLLCACGGAGEVNPRYREEPVKVYTDGEEVGELTLRFYNRTPNVPYLGMSEYSEYVKQQPLTIHPEGNDTYVLENGIGEELICDAKEGRIVVKDWGKFFDLPLPLEDEALGWKDTQTHFARITKVEYEGKAAPVTLDFAKYGIRLYADQDDIYLPVSTLSNIMTDIATNHMLYNGENLYVQRISLDGTGIEGFYQSERFKAEINGEKRKPDIIKQSYADLCFNFDYFFGHPGVAVLDEAIADKGLDQALKDLGKEGRDIRRGLLSNDLEEYVSTLNHLFNAYLSDGHTLFTEMASLMMTPEIASDTVKLERMEQKYFEDLLDTPPILKQMIHATVRPQRELAWGEEVYRESGSTAFIRLDGFLPDEEAWADYYQSGGDLPEDDLGIVASGLRKASQNPDIENVIFDLSCNGGGSPDVMMAILAMTTGQDEMYGIQKITGQKMTFTFEADTNFDGVFDEKDKETRYDFNYGVLVTRHAFSCGNLFPFIFQEGGAVVIGEPSSGGSCCVQAGTDAEGFNYYMSSARWQLIDSEGNTVEGGCSVDLPTTVVSSEDADNLLFLLGVNENLPFYSDLYDDEKLDEMMNEWFAADEESDEAA